MKITKYNYSKIIEKIEENECSLSLDPYDLTSMSIKIENKIFAKNRLNFLERISSVISGPVRPDGQRDEVIELNDHKIYITSSSYAKKVQQIMVEELGKDGLLCRYTAVPVWDYAPVWVEEEGDTDLGRELSSIREKVLEQIEKNRDEGREDSTYYEFNKELRNRKTILHELLRPAELRIASKQLDLLEKINSCVDPISRVHFRVENNSGETIFESVLVNYLDQSTFNILLSRKISRAREDAYKDSLRKGCLLQTEILQDQKLAFLKTIFALSHKFRAQGMSQLHTLAREEIKNIVRDVQ